MAAGKKGKSGLSKLIGFIIFIGLVIGGLYAFYKIDCKTDRKFLVWAQEKVGLYADKEGHLKQDATFKGDLGELEMDLNFTLKEDGSFVLSMKTKISGILSEESTSGTYKIDKNLVALTTNDEGKSETEYAYIYKGMLVYPINFFGTTIPIICTQEGVAVSQQSSNKVVGYCFTISVSKDDVESVINGKAQTLDSDGYIIDTGSKGQCYAIYANGTTSEKPIPINKDQITGFNSSEKGVVVVDVKIGIKSYKAPMYVK